MNGAAIARRLKLYRAVRVIVCGVPAVVVVLTHIWPAEGVVQTATLVALVPKRLITACMWACAQVDTVVQEAEGTEAGLPCGVVAVAFIIAHLPASSVA